MAPIPSQNAREGWRALGKQLAAYRKAQGHTQESLAAEERIHYGRSTVANVETGRQPVTRSFWVACDEVLGTGGALSREYDKVFRVQTDEQIAAICLPDTTDPYPIVIASDLTCANYAGQQSTMLASIWAVAISSGLIDGTQTIGRIGMSDVVRLRAVTAIYRSVDYQHGGGVLRNDVNDFAEGVTDLLEVPQDDAVRISLSAAVAEARQLAGWVAFDAGFHSDAQRHWQSAERVAVSADDIRLAARIRYCQARQYQHLRHNRDAIQTLRLARDHLGARATPALSAMLDGAEAASLAALGRHDDADNRLASASRAFEDVDYSKEPDWMQFFTFGEVLAQYGRVFRDRARENRQYGKRAVHWAARAVEAFGDQNVRSSILNQIGLCSALFLAGERDQAISVGGAALAQGNQISSARIHDRIGNLRRDLVDYLDDASVRRFDMSIVAIGSRST